MRILRNAGTALRALHGYESLAGALLRADPSAGAAGAALGVLVAAAREGVPSEEVVEQSPIVLTLIAPRIPPVKVLPAVSAVRPTTLAPAPTLEGVAREALRVRIRWVHELSARAAAELGRRLAEAGVIPDLEAVRYLRLDELETVLRTGQPFHPDGRLDAMRRTQLPPLFRLAADGTPIAVVRAVESSGIPVGGGRGRGVVRSDVADAGPGVVLVVPALDPRLAPVIPQLSGLVAETGSPLSHLAILAREYGVPTVVGKVGAVGAMHDGDVVEVDGSTGEVTVIDRAGIDRAGSTEEVAA
jgi:rifampicin phosphotransferase